MEKKRVLVLDRTYSVRYMKSELFETVIVCLNRERKNEIEKAGLKTVGCFEEEYDDIPVSVIPDNYLINSFDSDRFLNRYGYDKRLEILGKEISFWTRILDEYRPDAIVNEIVTIEFAEVMAIEAEKRKIPYYRWNSMPFAPMNMWVENKPFNSLMGRSFWDSIIPSAQDKKDAEERLENIRVKHTRPYYVQGLRKSYSVVIKQKAKAFWAFLNLVYKHYYYKYSGKFYYEDYYPIRKINVDRTVSKILHKQYDKLDFSNETEYLFYPLHFEPEAAIEYVGYYFNDQPMLIGRIAHAMKPNQKLIIKEHPQQTGALMTAHYRELKRRYPNIVFIPGSVSAYDIFSKVKCVITLCGTAGFEAWVCGKPVICFGDVFYRDFPGVTSCKDFETLHNIIRKDIFEKVEDEVILEYLSKVCHHLTHIFPRLINGKYEYSNLMEITKKVEFYLKENEEQ